MSRKTDKKSGNTADAAVDQGAEAATHERKGLFAFVDALNETMKKMSPGDLANLRRLAQGRECMLFHSLCASLNVGGPAWKTIFAGMATVRLHRPWRSVGAAMASADVSEARLAKLLSTNDEALHRQVRYVTNHVASKGEHFDWAELADLVLNDGTPRMEEVRARIARSYFLEIHKNKKVG